MPAPSPALGPDLGRNTLDMPAELAADNAHLLVVDDDARLRALLQRYLAEQGFRVTSAADAAAARGRSPPWPSTWWCWTS